MPKPINWSSVDFSELQQIEKSQSVKAKFQYKVIYRGYSVTIESANNLEKSKIQQLALEQMREQYLQSTKIPTTSLIPQKAPCIHQLIIMPLPLRKIVISNLTYEDIVALETVLHQYRQVSKDLDSSLMALKRQVRERKTYFQKELIRDILQRNPWNKIVNSWKKVSLEDKIWLLQLYELDYQGVKIPQITSIYDRNGPLLGIKPRSIKLLNPKIKGDVAKILSKVTKIDWTKRKLRKYPQAICLLTNLQELYLGSNELTAPPDVSRNVHLKILDLHHNNLETPPDIRSNIHLEILNLNYNQIKTPPDVSRNVRLLVFHLSYNKLATFPDVTRNIKLQFLNLSWNQTRATAPDLSQNAHLKTLDLRCNELTTRPDVSRNAHLIEFLTDECFSAILLK